MALLKKVFFLNLIIVLLFFGFKFFKSDIKSIKSLIEKIKTEFSLESQKNLIKEAYSVLTICEYFDSEFEMNIDNIRANSKKELQEIVSYAKQFLSPVATEIMFKSINIKKPEAVLLLNIKIMNSKNPYLLKNEYNLLIKLIKKNNTWLIQQIISQ